MPFEFSILVWNKIFRMNGDTGQITLSKRIPEDYRQKEHFFVPVSASDKGKIIQKSFANIAVEMIHENNFSPQICYLAACNISSLNVSSFI